MPYSTIPNQSRLRIAMRKKWYTQESIDTLLSTLANTKYLFQDARIVAADAITAFRNGGMVGKTLFSPGNQFPDGFDAAYYTEFDSTLAALLDKIFFNLTSTRSDTVGKDVGASRQPAGDTVLQTREQKNQDENRAFMAGVSDLRKLVDDPEKLWDRNKFEKELCLIWT